MTTPRLRIQPRELTRRRLAAVLSRAELAKRAGLSRRRVIGLENGDGGVRPETARALARALNCPVTEITEVVEDGVAS